MNCDSCEPPKNSFNAAAIGRMLINAAGVVSAGCVVILSLTTRSMRIKPVCSWFLISSPTVRTRRFLRLSMSSGCTSSRLTAISRRTKRTASHFVSVLMRGLTFRPRD